VTKLANFTESKQKGSVRKLTKLPALAPGGNSLEERIPVGSSQYDRAPISVPKNSLTISNTKWLNMFSGKATLALLLLKAVLWIFRCISFSSSIFGHQNPGSGSEFT
jgi:hypothetical protein